MQNEYRRNQAAVLEELFKEETIGFNPQQKVMWLIELFGHHIQRLMGIMKIIKRPVDSDFFESDFVNNLLLVSSLTQREIKMIDNHQALDCVWHNIVILLESIACNKSEDKIEELKDIYIETSQEISDLLANK